MEEIRNSLIAILEEQVPPLRVMKRTGACVEFCGTKARMQGKQMVDGFYFASVVKKPNDARFYFFPIYTHVSAFNLSPELGRFLKGKSCFHIKKWNEDLDKEIRSMIQKGIELYLKDDLI